MKETAKRVLVPGRNCWRIETADRVAFIIDAAEYFRHAKAAMLNAKHRIMLIGWDFDVRIEFEPREQTLEGPNTLGAFLSWLPKQTPELRIYMLKWDMGIIPTLWRGMTPVFIRNWMTSKRLRFELDGVHPPGAAHHQKIIVIDDALAFCGGIDMTVDRWDTREHLEDNPCRTKPNGHTYGPWHDATTAIDGQAARAVGDLARERWRQATDEQIDPLPGGNDPWPEGLTSRIDDVQIAIARTIPELDDRDEVCEIETLYLDAIAAARRTIYLESQYLASRKIAEALAQRLGEADGPEIVIVLPETTEGWLEHKAMDGARAALFRMLWRADRHKHFGAFHPVAKGVANGMANGTAEGMAKGGKPIYVHAKIMAIDDRLLRVGSSNLNNRSMSFDTECDLALEALPDAVNGEQLRETILAVRNDLLAEHLGVDCDTFTDTLHGVSGSILAAIARLQGPGQTLMCFETFEVDDDESALAENELLDPERRSPNLAARVGTSVRELVSAINPWG